MTAFNRVLWLLVGAVLTAAGLVGVLARFNVMPGLPRDRALITPGMNATWNSWGHWATTGVIVAGALLVLLGALLFWAETSQRGGRSMPDLSRAASSTSSTSDGGRCERGFTQVSTTTLNQAFSRDLQGDVRVRQAAVRLTGAPSGPDLRLRLAVTPDADVVELRHHVDRALRRFQATSGLKPYLAEVLVKMPTGRQRVR